MLSSSKRAKQVEIDAGDEAVFEFGIGEAVPLSEQDGFEHGQQGIGRTPSVVFKVTGSLTVQVLFDRLPINHLDPTSIAGSGRCVWRSWLVRFVGRRCSWEIP